MKKYLSILLNLIFPGLGHYYLGRKVRAVVFAVCICLTYLVGLALDLDHYYWYENIKTQSILVVQDNSANTQQMVVPGDFSVNSQWDPKVNIKNLTERVSQSQIKYFGHTKPGLTLEIINEKTGDQVQTQADYMGFFSFEPLELSPGDNPLKYGAANEYFTPQAGRPIHVSSYDTIARYQPGTLEKLWHFIYKMVFPVLTTASLHLSGGYVQGLLIHWWDHFPLVHNQATIPAPLRDVGFYFIILTCMFNLLIIFDCFDTLHNEEFRHDIP
jgi:hypothetical protein